MTKIILAMLPTTPPTMTARTFFSLDFINHLSCVILSCTDTPAHLMDSTLIRTKSDDTVPQNATEDHHRSPRPRAQVPGKDASLAKGTVFLRYGQPEFAKGPSGGQAASCLSWKHQYCIAPTAFLAYATPVNIRVTVHHLSPNHHRTRSPSVEVIGIVRPKVCKKIRE